MTPCRHQRLVLLGSRGRKLRCRRCGLTIDEEELGKGFCPECLEVRGVSHRDFEDVEPDGKDGTSRYRCEDCGTLIEAG